MEITPEAVAQWPSFLRVSGKALPSAGFSSRVCARKQNSVLPSEVLQDRFKGRTGGHLRMCGIVDLQNISTPELDLGERRAGGTKRAKLLFCDHRSVGPGRGGEGGWRSGNASLLKKQNMLDQASLSLSHPLPYLEPEYSSTSETF